MEEIVRQAEKEAYQEQDAELSQIFPGLSLSSRAEVVSLAQKLKEKEEEALYIKKVLYQRINRILLHSLKRNLLEW